MSIVKRAISRLPGLRLIVPLGRMLFPVKPFAGSAAYWEERYLRGGNSGAGSYGKLAEFKAEVINDFVASTFTASVIEFGCGDGNQLSLASYPAYIGIDVSAAAVQKCRQKFAGDQSKSFILASDYAGETADLALSLDVIYHLVEDSIFAAYMRDLFAATNKYVIIYSSNFEGGDAVSASHERHRNFTHWVEVNCPGFKLLRVVNNRYPYRGVGSMGSLADFYVYELVD